MNRLDFVTIPLSEFSAPHTKVAVSLPELYRITNHFSVKNAPGCVARLENSKPQELYLKYRVTCHLPNSNPNGHVSEIKFDLSKVKPGSNAKDIDVKVRCECPAFLYWAGQWNVAKKDGLLGEPRPLFQAPKERLDLRGNFYICKHLSVVGRKILPSVQHNINNILRKQEVEEYKRTHPKKEPSRLIQKRKQKRISPQVEKPQVVDRTIPSAAVTSPESKKKWLDRLRGLLSGLKQKTKGLGSKLKNKLFKRKPR